MKSKLFLIIFTFHTILQANLALITFYIPEEVTQIGTALDGLLEQGLIKKYIRKGKFDLYILADGEKEALIRSALRKNGCYLSEWVSKNADIKYQEIESEIKKEIERRSYCTYEIVFSSQRGLERFIASMKKNNHHATDWLCLKVGHAAALFGFLPGDVERFSTKDILQIKKLAAPGEPSKELFIEIQREQKKIKAHLEIKEALAPYDIRYDLLEMLRLSTLRFNSNRTDFINIIIDKLEPLSEDEKSSVLLDALRKIFVVAESIKEAESVIKITQLILLDKRISNLESLELLSKPVGNDDIFDSQHKRPQSLSNKTLKELFSLEDSPLDFYFEGSLWLWAEKMQYFVLTLPNHIHRTAMLVYQDEVVKILLLDPLNIQCANLAKLNKATFAHIKNFLAQIFPEKQQYFFSFDQQRLNDQFNCSTFALTDYQAISKNLAFFEDLMINLEPSNQSITPVLRIPKVLAISTQSLNVSKKQAKFLKRYGKVLPLSTDNKEKVGNAYVLAQFIDFFIKVINSRVSFMPSIEA